jgi:O-antigen biosynthesis protein
MRARFSEIVREEAAVFRATGSDPRILITLPLLRPTYLVFQLSRLDEALDPVLYFDRGQGFSEEDCMALEERPGDNFYVLLLKEMRGVKQVRLDPATRPVRFKYRTRRVYFPISLDSLARRLSKDASDSTPSFAFFGAVDGTDFQRRSVVAASIKAHYSHVIALPKRSIGETSPLAKTPQPTLSIVVPTYNTPPNYLAALIESFDAQEPNVAELILSDDGSTNTATLDFLRGLAGKANIQTHFGATNRGIANATNTGIHSARGRWIGLLDHDDVLAPFALRQVISAIFEHPEAMLFYTDEVIADATLEPQGYILKPSFDPVLLSGVNYINHFTIYRSDRLRQIGCLRDGFDGSQDYDLILRYTTGLDDRQIVHVPYPAYVWRRAGTSYSTNNLDLSVKNARKALAEHFHASIGSITVDPAIDINLHRPRLDASIKRWPRVSIVIPNRNSLSLLTTVLKGLLTGTDYPDYEIIVVDNGSDDRRVLQFYNEMKERHSHIRVDIQKSPFNFSRQVNRGIHLSNGEHVLLLNNDIQVISDEWLKEMVSCLRLPNVGIVGAKLLYPNKRLQHAGVIVGLGGLAGHWYEGAMANFPGPFGRLNVRQSLSAVTGACMLVSRACLQDVGKFDEQHFAVAYNDVDFCLRAAARGLRTVWTPFATLIHHESASRGSDETPANRERFDKEKQMLRTRHQTQSFNDPYFSPWFTRDRSSPGLVLHDQLPSSRRGSLLHVPRDPTNTDVITS